MPEDTNNPQPDQPAKQPAPAGGSEEETGPLPVWEHELDTYPLRKPDQDPRWAMWVFWIWAVFVVGALAFMTVLLVLGWFYD